MIIENKRTGVKAYITAEDWANTEKSVRERFRVLKTDDTNEDKTPVVAEVLDFIRKREETKTAETTTAEVQKTDCKPKHKRK